MVKAGLNNRIRLLVAERYVRPALESGKTRLSIRVKDVLYDFADDIPRNRTPAVCEVLQGRKLLLENGLRIETVDGPPSKQSSTVVVHYQVDLARQNATEATTEPPPKLKETSAEWAERVTRPIVGLLKEEMASFGGGDAFMKWVRSDDDEAE